MAGEEGEPPPPDDGEYGDEKDPPPPPPLLDVCRGAESAVEGEIRGEEDDDEEDDDPRATVLAPMVCAE